MHILPYLSTLVTFSFATAVFIRYLHKRGTHLLIWTIGLVFYGIGTLAEVILSLAFNELVLKLWYLGGAMLTAAWLGQGTVHLLIRKRGVAWSMTGVLVILSLLATTLIVTTPLASSPAAFILSEPVSSQYKELLPRSGLTIALTILLNIYGTITLVGGSVFSIIIFWRKRVFFNRMIGNILITLGALAPAVAGSFVKMGIVDALYLSELLGVVMMYTGFIKATATPIREPLPEISA